MIYCNKCKRFSLWESTEGGKCRKCGSGQTIGNKDIILPILSGLAGGLFYQLLSRCFQ